MANLNTTDEKIDISQTLIEKLKAEKDAAAEYQERKHGDWDDNYELYRNKIKTNRLTQRQAIGIPLMKETVKTLLSKIDDLPKIDWKEKGGDEDKEIIYQEVYDAGTRENKYELKDVMDKKNVLIYGIGTTKFNIEGEAGVGFDVLDPYDVTFDPYMLPGQVETARFIIHQNIFRPIREILADEKYTDEGKEKLKIWSESTAGVTQSAHNREQFQKKIERLKAMGLTDSDFKLFAGGDRVINLTEHFYTLWNERKGDWERRVAVYAEDEVILLDETLKNLIGVDFWPFVNWVEDPETTDVYSDSVADLVRNPNKIINVWFSQLIENRTLKNFQMHWFMPNKGYQAQTYTPGQGVMLPAPPGDDIRKVIMPVEITGLDDTLNAINAVTQIIERGTGATAIDKGKGESGQQTLGEVEILVGKSIERAIGMAKFYRMAWYERAWKWDKLMHANAPQILSLYKTGRSGRLYTKKVMRGDWKSKEGYEPVVSSSSEQETESVKTIQKFIFLLRQFPDNAPLKEIAANRMFDSVDLTPEELKSVIEAMGGQATPPVSTRPETPEPGEDTSGVMSEIENSLAELNV